MNQVLVSWVVKADIFMSEFFGASSANAQITGGSGSLTLQNPLGCGDFGCVLNNVINLIITLAIPICTVMVLYGGIKMATSSGDPAKVKEGRDTILYAAIGFAVVILAKGVTGFVRAFFTP